jgi:HSP20 family protein
MAGPAMKASLQGVPVRLFESEHRLMLVAPMPGLEPSDIRVTVDGDVVVIHGELRGPHQNDVKLVESEWSIGPYHREYTLPQPVDGTRANASYGNGVLVLALPKLRPGEIGKRAEFGLSRYVSGHGEHVGHVGSDLHGQSTSEHERRLNEMCCAAGTPDESWEEKTGEIPPEFTP